MNPDPDSGQLCTAEALRLLADEMRRRLLRELVDRADEGPLLQEEALEVLFEDAVEDPAPDGDGKNRELERLSIQLHHNHLPRLAEKDVIEWDDESNVISTGPAFDDLRPFVETFGGESDGLPDS